VIRAVAALLVFGCAAAAFARDVAPIAGVYRADAGDHSIQLYERDGLLYGRIVWSETAALRDVHNPNPTLRTRSVVGIEHLRGLHPEAAGAWSGGVLYNPEDGKEYDVKLWLQNERHVLIQGRPRIALVGALLGALFGRIRYTREERR
jgi:uncharacterized protein (DUF2147 family)